MQLTQLTDDSAYERNPAWSPDGKWIAYGSYADSDRSLNIIGLDNNDLSVLSHSVLQDVRVQWSPDSMKLIFTEGDSGKYQFTIMDRDGSNPVYIDGEPHSDYSWLPDGQKLVYLDSCNVNLIELSQMQPVILHEVHNGGCYFSLSPDGQRFLSIESNQVVIVNMDGSETTILIPEGLGLQTAPLWQP